MEGLWHAHFAAGPVRGGGMAVLRHGEILGGDPSHTYTGTYQWNGPELCANVCVSPYSGGREPADIARPVTFLLQGAVSGDSANASGYAADNPELTVAVELRRAE